MSDRYTVQSRAARAAIAALLAIVVACGGEDDDSDGFAITAGQGGAGGTSSGGASGSAGAGSAGAGNAGSGSAGSGSAGIGSAGVGSAGVGSAGAGSAGSGSAGSAGMSPAGSGGTSAAGEGGMGSAGTGVMPAGPGQPYDGAQCTEVVAATLSTPECAECICGNCLDLINTCRTDPDPSSNPNSTMTQGQQCEAVLLCGNENNCYGQLCYYGPCIFQIQDSFTGGMPNAADENTMGHPLFNATAAANCKADKCVDACAGNPEMQ